MKVSEIKRHPLLAGLAKVCAMPKVYTLLAEDQTDLRAEIETAKAEEIRAYVRDHSAELALLVNRTVDEVISAVTSADDARVCNATLNTFVKYAGEPTFEAKFVSVGAPEEMLRTIAKGNVSVSIIRSDAGVVAFDRPTLASLVKEIDRAKKNGRKVEVKVETCFENMSPKITFRARLGTALVRLWSNIYPVRTGFSEYSLAESIANTK